MRAHTRTHRVTFTSSCSYFSLELQLYLCGVVAVFLQNMAKSLAKNSCNSGKKQLQV